MADRVRYTIVFERPIEVDDAWAHGGSAVKAVERLRAELGAAINEAGTPVGDFEVVARRIVPENDLPLHELAIEHSENAVNFEDNQP